ncbi:MAG: zinc-ribbon domain-containing protein [Pirellulales bacterium]|nr:zinc-ribbon domain-containing protein [Pirellulales bacterium]
MNICGFVTSTRQCGQDLRSCPTCGKETFHSLERRRDWFTLFFVPVLPLGRGAGVTRCNLCGQEGFEGDNHASMSHYQAGTKTCPECAELIKLEARICRYCRHRFSEEEATAARQAAEARAAEMAEAQQRHARLRRGRVLSLFGLLLALPGGLWSLMFAILCASLVIQNEPGRPHVLMLMVLWLIMSTPWFLGLYLRKRARRIRREATAPPDPPGDAPSGTIHDDWGRELLR